MQYRPDIDGLRGIAIIAVVLFHFDIPGFPGGFTGVDVFFVISGYLITSLIHPEIASGRFSFTGFYERRIRRLLPALLAMVAVATVAGAALLAPHDLRYLHESAAAAVLFAANFLFWQTTGYFDPAAETRPLLHAWSLSVEEQFYIVFPVFLLLAWSCLRRHAYWLLAALAAGSLAASALLTDIVPSAAFYLPVFRAWELLLGALLALRPLPMPSSPALRNTMGLTGLALITAGIFAFSRNTPYPAANALVPCLGTALVIVAGSGHGSTISRLLGLRPLVFVGLISYSLYLWHWPLLVYARYFVVRGLTALETTALLAASLAIAVVSWRYIERPFRGPGGWLSRRALFLAAAAASALLVAFSIVGHRTGTTGAAPGEAARALPHQHCLNRDGARILAGDVCRLGVAESTPSFLLWGDSHAGALAPAVSMAATTAGRAGLLVGQAGCLPFPGVERHDRRDLPCREFNEAALRLLEQNPGIRTVLLAARWAMYTEGTRPEERSTATVLIAREGVAGSAGVFRDGLERTARLLAARGIEVVFVTQAPEIGWDVPGVLARSRAFGRRPPPSPSLDDYHLRQKTVAGILDELRPRLPLRIVDLSSILCPQGTCLIERGGQPLYLDSNHLGSRGNEFVAGAFADVF